MYSEVRNEIKGIWKLRSLIMTLALTDFQLRYKNTFLGLAWSVLEPLAMFIILYFVFTYLRFRDIENFGLFLFFGIIMWRLFQSGTVTGMNSIMSKKGIVSRIALPLEVPVLSNLLISVMTITFPLGIYFGLMAFLQFIPPVTIVLLPLIIILEAVLLLGVSLPLSALGTLYNDVKHVWPIAVHAGFFITPIWYDLSRFPDGIREWFYLNPMAGIITLGRSAVLGTAIPTDFPWVYTIVAPFIILVLGYMVFRHYSSRILEV